VTQPVLFAVEDGEHSAVTEGGIIVPADAADYPFRDYDEERKRGDIAEHLCAIELIKRGYICNVIGSGCRGYDIIADRGDIRAQHVQVKHGFPALNRYTVKNNARNIIYSATAYDILAFYMWDRGEWLIYGRAEFGARSCTTYTPPNLRQIARKSTTGMPDRQPNNWELFDQLAIANSQESLGVTQPMSHPIPQNLPIP